MAGKTKHILYRDGRFYARVVVPPGLRRIIGKTELREPLGADKRTAERNHHSVVASLLDQIDQARNQLASEAPPLTKIARDFYKRELERDDDERANGGKKQAREFNELTSSIAATSLRRLAVGRVGVEEAETLMGWAADEIADRGEAPAIKGTPERLELLRLLAEVKLEVLARALERDNGAITLSEPSLPVLLDQKPTIPSTISELGRSRVISEHSTKTLSELLPMFHEERTTIRPDTAKEHAVAVRMIEEFFGEAKSVCDISRQDVLAYKRALLRTPSNYVKRFRGLTLPEAIEANDKRAEPFPRLNPGTISDKWLAHIKAIFSWMANNAIIPDNPAAGIRVEEGAGQKDPSRLHFSPDDLAKIFGPPLFATGVPLETRHWALLLALHTGARPAEIARIELDEIRRERGVLVIDFAKGLKNKASIRLVPVHQRLIEFGLLERVESLRENGARRLFPDWLPTASGKFTDRLPRWFNRTYLPSLKIHDRTKTFYSFRHSLKTALSLAGVSKELNDAIAGHADKSSGAVYIHEFSIEARQEALNKANFDSIDWSAITKICKYSI
ncbi:MULTISPECIES: site-specific integrase [Alphaproteobacteria]|uniref:site-specific integrase n=1 Tax=Alphaproteobacteria TaxID=28211 RepID=UPI003266E3D9